MVRNREDAGIMRETGMDEPTFEAALDRLERIVDRLEEDRLELDESLALFEEGVRLLRLGEARLGTVEERLQQLFEGADGFALEPFPEER
jgi:exodeoxyribonuclease VII small subunit